MLREFNTLNRSREISFSNKQQKTALTKQPYLFGGDRKEKSAELLRCL